MRAERLRLLFECFGKFGEVSLAIRDRFGMNLNSETGLQDVEQCVGDVFFSSDTDEKCPMSFHIATPSGKG